MNDGHRRTNEPDGILDWTRRNFLRYFGTAAAAGMVPDAVSGCAQQTEENVAALSETLGVGPTGEAISASYVLARASDGLDLQMDLYNLQVNASNQLVQQVATSASYVVLHTHPQHVSESVAVIIAGPNPTTGAYQAVDTNPDDITSRSAGASRMAFCLAPGFAGVPFNLSAILNALSTSPLNIAANALSDGAVAGFAGLINNATAAAAVTGLAPDATVTSIEIPYRLLLSPNEQARFVHSTPPATLPSSGRVELFNSRLTTTTPGAQTVRALYSREYGNVVNPLGAVGTATDPLPQAIRQMIVSQSSKFQANATMSNWTPPKSVPVDNLILTPYGGTLQANANWEGWPGADTTLMGWKHRTSIGRDAFIQATLMGYVLPFGLRAIVTMTVQRQMSPTTLEFAALVAAWQIHLVETQRDFSAFAGLPLVGHRKMPFQRVVAQQTTFNVDAPATPLQFAALLYGKPVFIPMSAIDRRGRTVKFTAPIYWCANNSVASGLAAYNQAAPTDQGATSSTAVNVISLDKQRVALAPSTKDHTTVEIDWMSFQVANVAGTGTNNLYPFVNKMSATPEAARALVPTAAPAKPVLMTYEPSYAPAITASNCTATTISGSGETTNGAVVSGAPTQALVSFATPVATTFPNAKASGGLALPNATFGAIGLLGGLANGVADIVPTSGTTVPTPSWSTLLGGAKIFGAIGLDAFAHAAGFTKAPAFIAEAYTVAERYAAELELLADPQNGVLTQLSATIPPNATIASSLTALQVALGRVQRLFSNDPTVTPAQIATDVASWVLPAAAGQPLDGALARLGAPNSGLARAARNQLAKLFSAVQVGGAAVQAAIQAAQQGLDVARDQKAKIEWHALVPKSATIPTASFPLITPDTGGSNFTLSVEVNGKATDTSQALNMFCSLDNFILNFPPINPCVKLHFDRIFVSQQAGQKMEIDVNFSGLDFLNELSFVESVMSLIPLDGFSDPPHVDVTDDGITAGFSAGLANIAAGVLTFQNMKLSASLQVPFWGSGITFTFDFCDRDHPFLVAVAFLGGGGYFNLALMSAGTDALAIQSLEASISVSAQVSIDIIVASGSLSATAGITISYDANTGVSITAFVDLRGAVDILGLISMSIEAYLGLTYDVGTNTLSGTCTLTVDIDICFVSKSVSLSFHQSFWGGGSNKSANFKEEALLTEGIAASPFLSPTFAQAFPETAYEAYCSAFA